MMPTCGTYSAPATAARIADRHHMASFGQSVSYPRKRSRASSSRIAISNRPNEDRVNQPQNRNAVNKMTNEIVASPTTATLEPIGMPSTSEKPVIPLLPPNPVSLRNMTSIAI